MWAILIPLIQRAIPYILAIVIAFWCWHKVKSWFNGGRNHTPRQIVESVYSVDSGTQIKIEAGLRGRRTRTVTLYGIEIPEDQTQQARDKLTQLIVPKDRINIEIIEGRVRFTDIVGIVTSPEGVNCNLSLLRQGLAINTTDRKDFKAAEMEAKNAGRGHWAKEPKPHRWKEDTCQQLI